jgi:biopolymer transport protein ExbD
MDVPLNSLIDIFTIIIIFLLTASITGFSMTLTPGITIPKASFFSAPESTAIISVTNQYIAIDSKKVIEVEKLEQDGRSSIKELKKNLLAVKATALDTNKLNPNFKFSGMVTIEGDKDISFNLLQRIMRTCAEAGFPRISLAVLKIEKS